MKNPLLEVTNRSRVEPPRRRKKAIPMRHLVLLRLNATAATGIVTVVTAVVTSIRSTSSRIPNEFS